MVTLERGGNCYQERIGRLRRCSSAQIPFCYGCMNNHIKVWFYDMNLSPINGVYGFLIYIDTDDLLLTRRKDCRSGKANITEADNRDCFE